VVNEQDSCTKYDASNITLTSGTLNKSLTGVNAVTGQLDECETRAMILTAPGAGNQGTINIEYGTYSWLKYGWNWNGVDAKLFDENPTATATFGVFRGNDRIIYQREVFN
jgi:MSHA biogenesis protein MshQ